MLRTSKKAKCLRRQPEFSRLDKSRTVFLGGLTFVILLLMGGSIFYISTHIRAVDIGYKIDKELHQKQLIIEENKRLSLEIAQLKSPNRIESEAKEKFGLIYPHEEQMIYLSKFADSKLVQTLASAQKIKEEKTEPSHSKEEKEKIKEPSEKKKKSVKKVARITKSEPKKSQEKSQQKAIVAKKETPEKVVALKARTASTKKKLIIAKVIKSESSNMPSKEENNLRKNSTRRTKEIIPATLIDSMP